METPRESCSVCAVQQDASAAGLECFRDERWVVRHHGLPAPMAGWTLLCTARHLPGPADFSPREAAEFGPMAARVSRAIREITGCDRVYMIAFGQGAPHLHAHLIPHADRDTATHAWAVADFYRAVERGERAPAADADVRSFVVRLGQELHALTDDRRWNGE